MRTAARQHRHRKLPHRGRVKRIIKAVVIGFVALGVVIFAAAVAGGLMDDRAFTDQAHTPIVADAPASDTAHAPR